MTRRSSRRPRRRSTSAGDETILLVEDEAPIREVLREVLAPLGYRLIVAGSGEEALRAHEAAGGAVDLLLSDVIMPGMNGYDLADRLKKLQPGLRAMMMSGYNDLVAGSGVSRPWLTFLAKPLTPSKLRRAVRTVLGLARRQGDATAS